MKKFLVSDNYDKSLFQGDMAQAAENVMEVVASLANVHFAILSGLQWNSSTNQYGAGIVIMDGVLRTVPAGATTTSYLAPLDQQTDSRATKSGELQDTYTEFTTTISSTDTGFPQLTTINVNMYRGWITNEMIQQNSVSSAKIQSGAITSDKIGNSAVSTQNIAPGAVTAAKLSSEMIENAYIEGWGTVNVNYTNSTATVTTYPFSFFSSATVNHWTDGDYLWITVKLNINSAYYGKFESASFIASLMPIIGMTPEQHAGQFYLGVNEEENNLTINFPIIDSSSSNQWPSSVSFNIRFAFKRS